MLVWYRSYFLFYENLHVIILAVSAQVLSLSSLLSHQV
jgi:hypothetical protein